MWTREKEERRNTLEVLEEDPELVGLRLVLIVLIHDEVVAGISFVGESRNEGWQDLFVVELFPVDPTEPPVVLDVFDIPGAATKPLLGVFSQQLQ